MSSEMTTNEIAPATTLVPGSTNLTRNCFPADFVFGAGSSAIQDEGAANEGGRGRSIWDTFCDQKAAVSNDDGWLAYQNGNDQYHQFEMDTRMLQELGIKAYRFSISWPRILPNGTIGNLNKGVNKEGVAYYNNLINALKARDIEPYVTIFHWDLPQALEDKYGGFLSESIREDFKNYADFCFKEFGDRVKHWCTINEPYVFSWGGYALGTLAPGRGYPPTLTVSNTRQLANPNAIGVSNKFFRQIETMVKEKHPQWIRTIPPSIGDDPPKYSGPATEPYTVGYNLLMCHAVAYNLYQQKYKKIQRGKVGLTLNCHWFQAQDETSQDDINAAQRELDFMLGWFMKPLTAGNYPDIMLEYVGSQGRLPVITADDAKLLLNSFDFVGINYYTAYTVKDDQPLAQRPPHFVTDPRADMFPLGQKSTSAWIYVYPKGIENLLKEIKTYGDQIQIYVTENGIDQNGDDPNMLKAEYIWDDMRISYHHDHLFYICEAMIRNDVKVKGYFTWSFLDSFEFSSANDRFGNCFVDYDNDFQRTPKFSASWYKFFLQNGRHPIPSPLNVGLIGDNAEVDQAGIKRKSNGSEVANIEQGGPKRQK